MRAPALLLLVCGLWLASSVARADSVPCEVWEGPMPNRWGAKAHARLALCFEGDHAVGEFVFESSKAGWDRRRVTAVRHGHALEFHDGAMLENHAINSWGLCAADRWDLTINDDTITGTWSSSECLDDGSIVLHRIGPPSQACSRRPAWWAWVAAMAVVTAAIAVMARRLPQGAPPIA